MGLTARERRMLARGMALRAVALAALLQLLPVLAAATAEMEPRPSREPGESDQTYKHRLKEWRATLPSREPGESDEAYQHRLKQLEERQWQLGDLPPVAETFASGFWTEGHNGLNWMEQNVINKTSRIAVLGSSGNLLFEGHGRDIDCARRLAHTTPACHRPCIDPCWCNTCIAPDQALTQPLCCAHRPPCDCSHELGNDRRVRERRWLAHRHTRRLGHWLRHG